MEDFLEKLKELGDVVPDDVEQQILDRLYELLAEMERMIWDQ